MFADVGEEMLALNNDHFVRPDVMVSSHLMYCCIFITYNNIMCKIYDKTYREQTISPKLCVSIKHSTKSS